LGGSETVDPTPALPGSLRRAQPRGDHVRAEPLNTAGLVLGEGAAAGPGRGRRSKPMGAFLIFI
jgi:hypothetical protein